MPHIDDLTVEAVRERAERVLATIASGATMDELRASCDVYCDRLFCACDEGLDPVADEMSDQIESTRALIGRLREHVASHDLIEDERVNPCVVELRQQSLTLIRLVSALENRFDRLAPAPPTRVGFRRAA